MGAWLRGRSAPRPLRTYAWLELWIGAGGILILPGSQWLAQLDTLIWRQAPGLHLLGIAALVAVPTLAMGATVPVLARVAASYRLSLAGLYDSNLIGAALGVLLMTFVGLPEFGVRASCGVLVSINLLGAAAAWLWPAGLTVKAVQRSRSSPPLLQRFSPA